MKFVFTRSAVGRRAAAGTVLALTAATLSVGLAGTANADITVTDLKGTVTNVGGSPLAGIDVTVYNVSTGDPIDDRVTGVDGKYQFDDLEFNGAVKIGFEDQNPFTSTTTTHYLPRWYGGSRYALGSPALTLVADTATTANMTMPLGGIISGSLAAQDGHAMDGWDLGFFDSDDQAEGPDDGWSDAAGNFRALVEPGSHRIEAFGGDKGPDATWDTPDDISYLAAWWQAADTLATAKPIPVAAGQVVTGINIRLTSTLTARQAPQITGIPAVGRPLTATPGTWARNAGTEFSYTWMRGSTVVGTGATYTPTAADFGQRLNVVVRALNGANAGQATSALSDVVRYPADAKGKAKALAGHKVRFGVKIVSAKQSPVKGKVVVMRGTKVVHKAVKLVKGRAVILVSGQPKGKQVYTVLYKGNSLLATATKTFTVRVH